MTQQEPASIDAATARNSPALTLIAWLIILAIVAYMLAGQFRKSAGEESTVQGTGDAQFEIIGKYVVGSSAMTAGAGTTRPTTSPVAAALMPQLDQLAISPRNKLQAATVAGEVQGAGAALERLRNLQLEPLGPELDQDLEDLRAIYMGDRSTESDPRARERLAQHHGFFGRLAGTFAQPDSVEPRKTLLAHAQRTSLVLVTGGVAALGALILGIVLVVVAIVLFATGVLKRQYAPDRGATGVFVEMFAVYLASFFAIGWMVGRIAAGHPSLAWSWIMTLSLPLALAWGWFRGVRWLEMRRALGWHAGKGWHVEIPLGIAGYLAGIPVVALGLLITKILINHSNSVPSHPIIGMPTDTAFQMLNMLAIASVWAPVMEETMFRGALFHHMRRRWNWLISAAVVGLVFAAIHPQGWATIPVLGSIAVVLAGIREWRGSLLASIAAHGCNNCVLVCLLFALK